MFCLDRPIVTVMRMFRPYIWVFVLATCWPFRWKMDDGSLVRMVTNPTGFYCSTLCYRDIYCHHMSVRPSDCSSVMIFRIFSSWVWRIWRDDALSSRLLFGSQALSSMEFSPVSRNLPCILRPGTCRDYCVFVHGCVRESLTQSGVTVQGPVCTMDEIPVESLRRRRQMQVG